MAASGPKGRSIRRDGDAPSLGGSMPSYGGPTPRPVESMPGPADTGERKPFAEFGPASRTMTAAAEQNRAQSLGVLAIVGGGVFTVAAALVIAVVVILLYLGYRTVTEEIADNGEDKDRHIRDPNSVGPIEDVHPVGGGSPGRSADPAGGEGTHGGPGDGPPPGPATVIVPMTMMFLSIEINCPSGFRNRGSFRPDGKDNMRATVGNVPGDERCTVTFQGSEPARTWITGNQTKSCTFNPVVCRDVF